MELETIKDEPEKGAVETANVATKVCLLYIYILAEKGNCNLNIVIKLKPVNIFA